MRRRSSTYGFALTGGLLKQDIRRASESRGFAQSRVLTHWEEIAGTEMAAIYRDLLSCYRSPALNTVLCFSAVDLFSQP